MLLKRKLQAPQTKSPNQGLIPNLIAVSTSARNVVLTGPSGILDERHGVCHPLLSHHPPKKEEVICMIRHLALPTPPSREV